MEHLFLFRKQAHELKMCQLVEEITFSHHTNLFPDKISARIWLTITSLMLSLRDLRVILSIVAGLALAGCRSSIIVPHFSAAAGYRPQLPAQRFDTVAAATAYYYPALPQRRASSVVRPPAVSAWDHTPREKREPADKLGSRFAKAATGDTSRSTTRLMTPRAPRKQPLAKSFTAQGMVHYGLHFVFPVVLALVFFPLMWQTAYLIMVATMLIDLDHLLAKPIFDPLRCSIGYHPLHSFYAIPVYALLLLLPSTQVVAVGLLFHMFTDTVDCLWNFSHCHECYLNSRIYALRNWVRKLFGHEAME